MTTKDFFNQAYRLDQRINSKLSQIESLNLLATNCSPSLTGMPRNPSPPQSVMADAVCKIIDLETEIKRDIDQLVTLKAEIITVIRNIENIDYQLILEKRYLLYLTWEQIAVDMNYDLRYLHKLHSRALAACVLPTKYNENS